MKIISIIIPCHNEENNISILAENIVSMANKLPQYSWQVIFVDDGSKDNTVEKIREVIAQNKMFSYISFSRNFGKEEAILAGLDNATGNCAIIMDADLQHPVNTIPDMIKEWENGYEDVYGDFRLLDRKCIDALKQMRETQRYTKGLYCWIGFKKKEILFNQSDRQHGKSSFNFFKLLNFAIEGITSYTTTPLRLSTIFGILSSLSAFMYMIFVFIKTILFGEVIQGFPTIIIIILFLGGIQLISLGVIGEYLGRIFHETKRRPNYIIREKEGF